MYPAKPEPGRFYAFKLDLPANLAHENRWQVAGWLPAENGAGGMEWAHTEVCTGPTAEADARGLAECLNAGADV